jgi:hypothetical protein
VQLRSRTLPHKSRISQSTRMPEKGGAPSHSERCDGTVNPSENVLYRREAGDCIAVDERGDKQLGDEFITSVQYARASLRAYGMNSPAFIAAAKASAALSFQLRRPEICSGQSGDRSWQRQADRWLR